MPDFPIIDSHVHFYDPARLSYGWIERLPDLLRQPHGVAEFRAATAGIAVEKVATIEFLVDPGLHLAEAEASEELASAESLVGAFVAHVPVERGAGVEADLEALASLKHVRGVRRILDGQYDRVLEPDFIAGVQTVGRYGLPFEFGVSHYGLVFALELARRAPDTLFILDHLATPAIRYGLWEPWASQIAALAALPNVVAKISGVLAGVDPANWRQAQILPYLGHALDCFGFDRVMFGSDWPMLTEAATYADWLAVVETAIAGATASEQRKLFRDTAARLYRLGD
jgi:predicted TIM-barrel fold metal-dependent hydrolase